MNIKSEKQGRNIIREVPHRNIGGINLPGYDDSLMWESPLERAGTRTISLCRDIVEITAQQITFTYQDKENNIHSYTPDLVIRTTKEVLVIEVKSLIILLRKENREKYSAISRSLFNQGHKLNFITDDQIYVNPRHKNIELIYKYRANPISEDQIKIIHNICCKRPHSINQILNLAGYTIELATIYTMICRGFLSINWNERISTNSIITLPASNQKDLTYEQIHNSGRHGSTLEELVLGGEQEAERVLAIAKTEQRRIRNINPLGFF